MSDLARTAGLGTLALHDGQGPASENVALSDELVHIQTDLPPALVASQK
jgi:hypothetical protein